MTQLALFRRHFTDHPTYKARLAQFEAFDAKHPEVFELFQSKATELLERGIKHYSSRALLEVLRWHFTVNAERDGGFKINNNFAAFYARKLMEHDATFAGFFELRGEPEEGDEACGNG